MTARDSAFTTLVLLAVTGMTAALSLLDVTGPLRLVVTLVFFLLAPGWSVLAFFRPGTSSITWALVVAISLAADLLVAQLMLVTGAWRPGIASACFLSACAVLLVSHLVTGRRTQGAPS